MAVAGLPEPRPDHAEAVAHFALGMLDVLAEENAADRATPFELRIGIHTGPVVAGIIGRHKFIYDVWGDTVNIASRMESSGRPGRIHISDTTRAGARRPLPGRAARRDRAQGTGEGGRVLPGRAGRRRELKRARPEAARTAVAILLLLGHSSERTFAFSRGVTRPPSSGDQIGSLKLAGASMRKLAWLGSVTCCCWGSMARTRPIWA